MFKITVRESEKKQAPIDWRTLPVGTVIEFEDRVKAVVFGGDHVADNRLVLLAFPDGDPWFVSALGYEKEAVAKVLGTIEEIVVRGV